MKRKLLCPVKGTVVDPITSITYGWFGVQNGKGYLFCCNSCKDKFGERVTL